MTTETISTKKGQLRRLSKSLKEDIGQLFMHEAYLVLTQRFCARTPLCPARKRDSKGPWRRQASGPLACSSAAPSHEGQQPLLPRCQTGRCPVVNLMRSDPAQEFLSGNNVLQCLKHPHVRTIPLSKPHHQDDRQKWKQ